MAKQLEAAEGDKKPPLDFCCTIMLIGKTGVGKSATINSIFDEVNKANTSAFHMGTDKVHRVVGTVEVSRCVKLTRLDFYLPGQISQRRNEKILHSVKRFVEKTTPPDVVLYLDRLDLFIYGLVFVRKLVC